MSEPYAPSIVSYRVFDESLLILSESEKLSHHIDTYMSPLKSSVVPPSARFMILECGNTASFALVCPEQKMARILEDFSDAWIAFRRMFMRLVFAPSQRRVIFHAAAIACGEHAATLIIGHSSSGKTSTLIGLLGEGFRLICDDYCGIDTGTGQVTSLPVGATVSEKTLELFPHLRQHTSSTSSFTFNNETEYTVNLSQAFEFVSPYSDTPISHIFFLYPEFGSKSQLEACDTAQANWELNNGVFNSRSLTPTFSSDSIAFQRKCMDVSKTLADQAKCFRLRNGSVYETVSIICETVTKAN